MTTELKTSISTSLVLALCLISPGGSSVAQAASAAPPFDASTMRSPNGLVRNPDGRPDSSFVAQGASAMVATAGDAATRIGVNVLRAGGSAVDAAVAVSFAISVERPQSTGIGGGGFMLVRDAASGTTTVYDFRESAPGRATPDMYLRNGGAVSELSLVGHRAVGVPGTVAGLIRVHEEHGTMPLRDLIAPAIRLASEGFSVYPELARRIEARKEALARNPAIRMVLFRDGTPLREGDLLIQSDLARTLSEVAERGRSGFYEGPVADAIVADMKKYGGILEREDLASYTVKIRRPVRGTYRGFEILSMPPPSSGGTHLVQMLKVLEGYDLRAMGLASVEATHLMIESMRRAYADRAEYMGDPGFVEVPVEALLSPRYAEESRAAIPLDRARSSTDLRPGLGPERESSSTTHLSIVDKDGNVVSSTQTINYSFGACVIAEGTGVILNDEMDDFSAQPGAPNVYGLVGGAANAIAPGKRPLSSMTPTIVLKDDRPVLVLGSPGGSRIITSVLQTIINVVDHELDLFRAVAHGRIHHQWLPDEVVVEKDAFPHDTVQGLRLLGHRVVDARGPIGEVQAIHVRPDGTLEGVSDPRRSGRSMGY